MKSYSKILTLILAFIPSFCFAATPECPPTLFEKVIALSPIIIYLFITSSVFLKLKKEDVSLKQLLLDKDMWVTIKEKEVEQTEADAKKLKEATDAARLAVDNNQGEQANRTFANLTSMAATATQTRSVGAPTETEQQSVSRLLAFISGLVSVGLACVITSFFIWQNFAKAGPIQIEGLTNALLALGIGVVPYAFNKVASAIK